MISSLQTHTENILKWSMQKHNSYFDLAWIMCSDLNYFWHSLSILNSEDSYANRKKIPLHLNQEKNPLFELLLPIHAMPEFPQWNGRQSYSLVGLVEKDHWGSKRSRTFLLRTWPWSIAMLSWHYFSLNIWLPRTSKPEEKMSPFCWGGRSVLLLSCL